MSLMILPLLIALVIGGGLGFLVGFLVFRNKHQTGHGRQPQFAQPQQWQAMPQQQWQQQPPQPYAPQQGYGQYPPQR